MTKGIKLPLYRTECLLDAKSPFIKLKWQNYVHRLLLLLGIFFLTWSWYTEFWRLIGCPIRSGPFFDGTNQIPGSFEKLLLSPLFSCYYPYLWCRWLFVGCLFGHEFSRQATSYQDNKVFACCWYGDTMSMSTSSPADKMGMVCAVFSSDFLIPPVWTGTTHKVSEW